jgi:hypothetical protein
VFLTVARGADVVLRHVPVKQDNSVHTTGGACARRGQSGRLLCRVCRCVPERPVFALEKRRGIAERCDVRQPTDTKAVLKERLHNTGKVAYWQGGVKACRRAADAPNPPSMYFFGVSFRKAVLTRLMEQGVSVTRISAYAHHKSIDSQMSYMCKNYEATERTAAVLYVGLD